MSEVGVRRSAVAVLVGFALAFAVLHLQLARSARLVPDDLSQRASVAAHGVVGVQRTLYALWSGRWVSNGMVASAMAVLRHERAVSGYAVVLLGLVIATGSVVACALLRDRVRPALAPLLAAVTTALLFFATPHRGDSWFFVFCSLENVVPLCAALACAARATILAIAVLSFAISAASPGSSARLSQMPRHPLVPALWAAATEGPGVLLGIARAPAAPLATTRLAWAAATSVLAPADPRAAAAPLRHVVAVALASLLLAPVVAFTATFPGFYSLGEPPPARALLVLAVLLVAAAVAIGSVLGAALHGRSPAEEILAAMLAVAVLRVGIDEVPRMRSDVATAQRYAEAYDARVALLRALPRTPSENRCLRRMLGVVPPLLRAASPVAPPA